MAGMDDRGLDGGSLDEGVGEAVAADGAFTGREIAVVGMSGRFPGARNLGQLWRNLRQGVEAVTFFSATELLAAGVPAGELSDPHYVRAGSLLAGVEDFDAGFFGYSAREAEIMDPQQRLFLEHAWEALEDAGYAPDACPGVVGIYAGVAWNTYLLSNLTTHPELFDGGGAFQVFIANDKDFMPSKVSYKLNLKGPSVVVQTSCSTSLVAVHLACLSLLSYECDTALAGGVTIKVPQVAGYHALEGGLASPDGHCRAFDARAAGTVFGSGAGVVVLKRLADAVAGGDAIRAVIKGSAINNDGSLKVSYTAPGVEGQAEVIAAAQAVADVDPATISYVEAHGTGTALGDPIEVTALTKVFRESTSRTGFCALGSIKTNLGHLDAAAGIAGFIKTVLALEHRELPPSLHFAAPNPAIDFAASPFFVNRELRPWQSDAGGAPRRAGVSSFGVGGTNAHVILEEAPPPPRRAAPARPWQLLTLSARSPQALEEATANLLAWLRRQGAAGGDRGAAEAGPAGAGDLDGDGGGELADAAWTLRVGRAVFRHRRTVLCRGRADAAAALADREGAGGARVATAADSADPRERPVVFLLPGLPAAGERQRLPPLVTALAREAAFAGEMARAGNLLAGRPGGDSPAVALFVFEHALARLWIGWGVAPQALYGQGAGEWVAACLAGVLSPADALALLALKASGDAAAFGATLARTTLRAPQIPCMSALTGGWLTPEAATSHDHWQRVADAGGQPAAGGGPPASAAMGSGGARPDGGAQIASAAAAGLAELVAEPRRILLEVGPGAVLCQAALAVERPAEVAILPSLPAAIAQAADGDAQGAALATLGRLWLAGRSIDWSGLDSGESRRRVPLPTYPFERQRYWIEPRPRLAGRSMAGAGTAGTAEAAGAAGAAGALERRPDVADWFWLPAWRPALRPAPAPPPAPAAPAAPVVPAAPHDGAAGSGRRLILAPSGDRGAALARRLVRAGGVDGSSPAAVWVEAASGGGTLRRAGGSFALDPGAASAWGDLAAALAQDGALPEVVLHLWTLDPPPPAAASSGAAAFERAQERGLYALLDLLRALDRQGCSPRQVIVVGAGLLALHAGERVRPALAPLLGLCRVVPQELAGVACRVLDIDLAAFNGGHELSDLRDRHDLDGGNDLGGGRDPGSRHDLPQGSGAATLERLAGELAAEIAAGPAGGDRVALRAGQRWLPAPAAVRLDDPGLAAGEVPRPLRRGGAYLLTGGLSGDGFALACWLARTAGARLALLEDPRPPAAQPAAAGGSTPAPAADLASPSADPASPSPAYPVTRPDEMPAAGSPPWDQGRVRQLEALGAAVLVLPVEPGDEAATRAAVARAEAAFGPLHGVIHAAQAEGRQAFRLVSELDRESCGWHLQPKAHAAYALDRALAGRDLDFCILLSSLAADLGGVANAAYAAANAFLDAFAHDRARAGGLPWRSLGWDVWQPAAGDQAGGVAALRRDLAGLAMTEAEGEQAFGRAATALGIPHLWISTAALPARLDAAARRGGGRGERPAGAAARHPRPSLPVPYAPPASDLQRRIAEVWQAALGFADLGIDDNFFELGGDSLAAVQVAARLQAVLGVQLPVAKLYQGLTVRALAALLSRDSDAAAGDLAAQLAERRQSMDRRREMIERRRARTGETPG